MTRYYNIQLDTVLLEVKANITLPEKETNHPGDFEILEIDVVDNIDLVLLFDDLDNAIDKKEYIIDWIQRQCLEQ